MEHVGGHAVRWIFLEGLLPLAGAGVLYLIWGWARYMNAQDKSKFTFAWGEAKDPLGWLYGGGILSVQLIIKSVSGKLPLALPFLLGADAALCTILLLSAMTERGQNPSWKPTKSVTTAAVILVATVLVVGAIVYHYV